MASMSFYQSSVNDNEISPCPEGSPEKHPRVVVVEGMGGSSIGPGWARAHPQIFF